MKKLPRVVHAAALAIAIASPITRAETTRVADLADYSLEQLANLKVTTVSRREERLVDAPASVFVITSEDIRRSGATSLGDALRLAPNLMVIQSDQNQFVASARGGLAGLANKMLVLIDGRIVYSPLFSGVFWDAQDLVLADIERIEVISGPGSTLWGINAVNGVINVITRPASATQGVLALAYGGDTERGATLRFGAPLGDQGAYRLYAKYARRDDLALASGASAMDGSERRQAGFRADWNGASGKSTLQGDVYTADVGNVGGPRDLDGGNLLARWGRTLDSGSKLMAQAYYDRRRRVHEATFDETLDTFDAEILHTLRPIGVHEVSWGAEWRVARDRTRDTPALALVPRDRTLDTVALFAQDEVAIAPDWKATLGVRAEHSPYAGLEWLPNLRLSWAPTPDHLLWGALTRTVRSPSRIDRDLEVPGAPPFVLVTNDTFQSEVANVAEVGWRARLARGATISLTAFHHDFRDLRTIEPGAGALVVMNGASGRVTGIEGWGDWRVTPDWRWVGGFTLNHFDASLEPGHTNLSDSPLGNNPKRTALLRSLWNLTPRHELDLAWRYQGALDDPRLPGYAVVDARLGWRVTRALDVSLIVRNAFDKEHLEFPGPSAEIGRAWLVRVIWSP